MKTIRLSTIFFLLKQLIFLSFVSAQTQNNLPQNQRLKLLNAHYVLLNGDSVKISSLNEQYQKEIREQIRATCARNMAIAQNSIKNIPAKAYHFAKNTLLLDSTYSPAHAVIIQLYLDKKDTAMASQTALTAYQQTGNEKFIPIIEVLGEAKKDKNSIINEEVFLSQGERAKYLYTKGYASIKNDLEVEAYQLFESASNDQHAKFAKATLELFQSKNEQNISNMLSFYQDSLLSVYAAYNLSVYYYNNQDLPNAKDWCQKAISKNDSIWDAYFLRGLIYYETAQAELALSDFEICISKNHKKEEALTNLAICQYDLKMFKEAIETTSVSIDVGKAIAENYIIRGNAYEMLYDFEKACSDWQQAIELGRNDIELLITDFCRANQQSK